VATIYPFRAAMPTAEHVARVSSLPYDVMSRGEAAAIVARNPDSFLRVTRAEVELPEATAPYDEAVYRKAGENYARLRSEGVLCLDDTPHYYVYRMGMGEHMQTGIGLAASVDDYELAIIRKHERTRPGPEKDRTDHMLAVGAHTGPVFLTYRGQPGINEITARTTTTDPVCHFTSDDGIRHALWRMPSALTCDLTQAFRHVPCLYIADGHHRAAGAARVRATRRAANPDHTGEEIYNHFLAVAFPADQLQILPYNRVVATLNGRSVPQLLEELGRILDVSPAPAPQPARPGLFHMYLAGKWWSLSCPGHVARFPTADSLDVSLLQNLVLQPLFGIADPRADERIQFVGGIRGADELERLVDEGRFKVAFTMYPTTVEQLMAISDSGQIMPPKSTWFEPKLRDGVLVHEFAAF